MIALIALPLVGIKIRAIRFTISGTKVKKIIGVELDSIVISYNRIERF
jgi:hypothetical protein